MVFFCRRLLGPPVIERGHFTVAVLNETVIPVGGRTGTRCRCDIGHKNKRTALSIRAAEYTTLPTSSMRGSLGKGGVRRETERKRKGGKGSWGAGV